MLININKLKSPHHSQWQYTDTDRNGPLRSKPQQKSMLPSALPWAEASHTKQMPWSNVLFQIRLQKRQKSGSRQMSEARMQRKDAHRAPDERVVGRFEQIVNPPNADTAQWVALDHGGAKMATVKAFSF